MVNLCFLGLDLSVSGSGVHIIDSEYNSVVQYKLKAPEGTSGIERLFFLETDLKSVLTEHQIAFCCIEGAAFGKRENSQLFTLGELNGIVKLHLYKNSIKFITPAPLQLKKYVTGQGKGEKSLIILDVYKNFGIEIRDNDIADAYVLSRIARDYFFFSQEHQFPIETKKYQQEVLKKLLESNTSSFLL